MFLGGQIEINILARPNASPLVREVIAREITNLKMGRMTEFTQDQTATSSLLGESLLLTTMSIIGLPVEVHIIDGSIFSGIFHTASVENGYGIALKKAKMIKKGTQNANVSNGGLIDTLVVLPGDLVQIVAKGVTLPADYAPTCVTCDEEGTASQNGAVSTNEQRNQERQVGVAMLKEDENGYHCHAEAFKEVPKDNSSCTSLDDSFSNLNVCEENHKPANDASLEVQHAKEFTSTNSVASDVTDSAKTRLDVPGSPVAVPADVGSQNTLVNRTAKESKLNPSAKVFSPSFPNLRSTPPLVQTAPSVAYVTNSIPPAQVAGAQPEVEMQASVPRTSWPVKFFPYVTSTAVNAENGLQYTQPVASHIVTRAPPIRHVAQYQPIQAVPPYVHHSPQNGIFARPGQLVYVHPVAHDVIQAPVAVSQAPHPYMTPHPIHVGIAKNEGLVAGQAMPVSMTPPLVANGAPPFTTHIQPLFSSIHPVSILGPKFP
ncbi:unnamed protein product [Amaranthus hypochondriacus]